VAIDPCFLERQFALVEQVQAVAKPLHGAQAVVPFDT